MTRRINPVIVAAGLLLSGPSSVCAQSERLIAFGVGVTADRPAAADGWESTFDYLIFRVPRPLRLGIAWDIGSDTDDIVLAGSTNVPGALRMRHVLFGPGYTWRHGRTEVTASALLGPSFNLFTPADDESPGIAASAAHSFVFRPDVTCWIDLGPRVGLKLSASYRFSNADVSIEGEGRTEQIRWNARRFRSQVGIVYGVF